MTLEWSSSIDKKSLLLCNVPDSLKGALSKVWQQHYEELYEPEAEGTASLQEALDEILEPFQGGNRTLSHLRYVWMALILASVVEPTVKYYQPNSSIPEETINRIAFWLLETLEEMVDSKMPFSQVAREKEANALVDAFRLFTENKEIASFQVLSEALDVYSSAIKTLDSNQSLEALLDILDDCLEGYAIFPGSYGRRELFDWWLLEVVPASWCLLPPSSIYSVDKSANEKIIVGRQMEKLKKISSAMWSIILKNSQNRKMSSLETLHNKFDSYSNKMELAVKLRDDKFSPTKIASM
jgi:hypothetical protein